jgi:ArsR family transcriptional regulator, arsenate/arsenite/antimonite-responsive transcriptional repressor
MDTRQVIEALAALAQENRLAIYRLLLERGPDGVAAKKIAETLGMPASSLSFHLKELMHAELIRPRQDGRYIYYTALFDTMNGVIAFLTENCCGGNPCTSASPVECDCDDAIAIPGLPPTH